MPTLRELSVKTWAAGDNRLDSINAGSMQRIADAVEKMARRHTELIREKDMYRQWYEDEGTRRKFGDRRLAAAKGQITKLNKKIAQLKEQHDH